MCRYVEDFDGSDFALIDRHRADLQRDAEELRCRVAVTRRFGDLLTGDVIALGLRAIRAIDIRNPTPDFPPLLLTYLQNLDWVGPTDAALVRMSKALEAKPKTYRQFLSYAADQPMAGMFELNVYRVLDDAFPPAEPAPVLPGTARRGDVRVRIDGVDVFVEATVIGEGQFWDEVYRKMAADGWKRPYGGAAPGPHLEAMRIASKVADKLSQTTPAGCNLLCLSFFGHSPSKMARDSAFPDIFVGGKQYGHREDGTTLDFSGLGRLDSIFEFSRDHLEQVRTNPAVDDPLRLPASVRDRIAAAFAAAPLMIR